MNKERQRKLEARERRQASLGNIGTSIKEPKPITEKKVVINHVVPKPIDVDHVKKVVEVQHIEKRGRGRPKKIHTDLPVAKKANSKDKRKNK